MMVFMFDFQQLVARSFVRVASHDTVDYDGIAATTKWERDSRSDRSIKHNEILFSLVKLGTN